MRCGAFADQVSESERYFTHYSSLLSFAAVSHARAMASGGLFRKFSLDDVSTQNNVKSSVQRAIRGEIGRERGGRGGERGEGEAAREEWEVALLLARASISEMTRHSCCSMRRRANHPVSCQSGGSASMGGQGQARGRGGGRGDGCAARACA